MMTRKNAASPRPRGGLADKRRAIIAGALTMFARDGYTRASMDAISAEAGVSTRTVYNHFTDKAELFRTVIRESATRFAEAQIAIIERYLHRVSDLEPDLVEFGLAFAKPIAAEYADHFALVRQVNAEAGHIPQEAIEAWQEAGPLRVRRALAERLSKVAEQGLLRLDNPEQAALQLMLLISASTTPDQRAASTDEELTETVTAGVHTFLYGHAR
ncbi:TetR/AcrR family transcriptional regulator [Saccharopolyspora oryzae]|uniref:TetR/AcrR family transcriptional regulator n=1 Tax=Saccharopolyspora oryzae TaxID=2997343 RepID=A0ABT4UX09_9PSEU|nr:TetR/AcrR family transcriptional regulator [Saccharopolyspora oryzae]MDA3626103.1 TetR/AcrR family transcriptional regulator [Saccharopolyspora oryzae]